MFFILLSEVYIRGIRTGIGTLLGVRIAWVQSELPLYSKFHMYVWTYERDGGRERDRLHMALGCSDILFLFLLRNEPKSLWIKCKFREKMYRKCIHLRLLLDVSTVPHDQVDLNNRHIRKIKNKSC